MPLSFRSLRSSPVVPVALCALATLVGCNSTADEAGRTPLAAPSASALSPSGAGVSSGMQTGAMSAGAPSTAPTLPPEATRALDAGNAAYRAKNFSDAERQYRQAASIAPTHAAPWFGLYMVANEVKNTTLADSAMAHVRALSSDPAALDAHAQVSSPNATAPTGPLPAGHPQTTQPALPPGHPTTQPTLPPGHPAPSSPKAGDTTRRRM